jgi:hypothetical protein
MFKTSEDGRLPIEVTVMNREVSMTRSLLILERAHNRGRGCWSSQQLSSLVWLGDFLGTWHERHPDASQMLKLLLEFEVD